MSLIAPSGSMLVRGFPRVSGDEPKRSACVGSVSMFSPRERG